MHLFVHIKKAQTPHQDYRDSSRIIRAWVFWAHALLYHVKWHQ